MVRNQDSALCTPTWWFMTIWPRRKTTFSKSLTPRKTYFFLESIIVNSTEFQWFGTKSISHITEYSRQLKPRKTQNIYMGLSMGPIKAVWAIAQQSVFQSCKISGSSRKSSREGDCPGRKTACRSSGMISAIPLQKSCVMESELIYIPTQANKNVVSSFSMTNWVFLSNLHHTGLPKGNWREALSTCHLTLSQSLTVQIATSDCLWKANVQSFRYPQCWPMCRAICRVRKGLWVPMDPLDHCWFLLKSHQPTPYALVPWPGFW